MCGISSCVPSMSGFWAKMSSSSSSRRCGHASLPSRPSVPSGWLVSFRALNDITRTPTVSHGAAVGKARAMYERKGLVAAT